MKIVLTVIALGLWVLLLKPFIEPKSVIGTTGIIDVNIKQIDGKNIKSVLDVNIEKINGMAIYGNSLPVELKK
jgi:hypothetical protein